MRLLFLSFSFFLSISCFAQSDSVKFEDNLEFLLFLGQNGQNNDFDFFGEKLLNQGDLNGDQKDSLNFALGLVNFKHQNYNKSLHFLTKVSDLSVFYPKSTFYSEICYVEKKDYSAAYNYLRQTRLDENNKLLQQLRLFEFAGLSLLKRDYSSFLSLDSSLITTNAVLNNEIKLLKGNYNALKNLRRKSPFVAGTLSAVVPGLGLAYAGNNGQALAAFLRVVGLGVLSTENYIKLGPRNPQFIISSCLFCFFYLGNIWGSVLSVQILKNEKLKEIDYNIMASRIPIDHFFN